MIIRVQGLASGFISWRKLVKLVTVQLDDDHVSEMGTSKQLALWFDISKFSSISPANRNTKLTEEKMGNPGRFV